MELSATGMEQPKNKFSCQKQGGKLSYEKRFPDQPLKGFHLEKKTQMPAGSGHAFAESGNFSRSLPA
jgi:hypothetical protein